MNHHYPFFSVIMTVYNTEKYLDKAIHSILNQTFTDFELIIIDDGSDDLSKTICSKYVQQDDRVSLKETAEHIGVANARNEGLKWIQGEYFTFVDSDDYIDADIFEAAEAKIKSFHPEVLKYGCIEEYYDGLGRMVGSKKIHIKECYLADKQHIRKSILDMEKLPLFGYVWNAFYSVSILNIHKIHFDIKMHINEDFDFNLLFFDHIEKLYCLDKCAYHYAKRIDNSLSTKRNNEYYKFHVHKIEKLLAYYREWELLDFAVKQKIFWLYTRGIYSTLCREITSEGTYKITLNEIHGTDLYRNLLEVSTIGLSKKEKFLMDMLKNKHIFFVYLLCRLMNFTKNNLQVFFSKIKG